MKHILLTIFLPSILAQYVADLAMKPDVTFGDHNDRFDLRSFIKHQNRYFNRHSSDEDDYRRRDMEQIKKPAQISRRDFDAGEFAYHDDMDGSVGGTMADFEENLNRFKSGQNRRAWSLVEHLHGGVEGGRDGVAEVGKRRRSGAGDPKDPEKEILLHYAVPIEATINGYLQVPLVE